RPLPHEAGIKHVAFSRDGAIALSTTWGDSAHLWSVASGDGIGKRISFAHGPTGIALSPDSKTVLIGNHSACHAQLFDASTGQTVGPALTHQRFGSVYAVAFSPDGKTVLVGGVGGAQRWDAATSKPLGAFVKHGNVETVGFSPDGQLFLTAAEGVRLWRTDTGNSTGITYPYKD